MPGFTFNGEVSLGQLIPIIALMIGVIGGYYTLRARVQENTERTASAEKKASDAMRELTEFKLEVSKGYVHSTALREVKDDLSREIRDIEHVVRNSLMQILGQALVTRGNRRGGDGE